MIQTDDLCLDIDIDTTQLPKRTIPVTQKQIYLDYNATTPVDPRVIRAMLPYFTEHFGNPSSAHAAGRAARAAVDRARRQIASMIGCAVDEVIFTSGGSESNNTALKGLAQARRHWGNHIITSQIEHPAILNPLRVLEGNGFTVTRLPVDQFGQVIPAEVERAITPETILISIMHANNEVGTIQPIAEIGRIAREHGVLFHTDACQSAGKIQIDVKAADVDALTISGHKLYAPKGIGVLYVRRGVTLEPLVHGSGHECGRRAGTENVPGIVALGEACALSQAELSGDAPARLRSLRDRLWDGLRSIFGARVHRNGHTAPDRCVPGTLNISIDGLTGGEVLDLIPEIAASTGSACHSDSAEPSAVLVAMGVSPSIAAGAIRISLGRWTTTEQVERVLRLFRLRVGSGAAC
jgi:cysteine desulfurase